MKGVLLFEGNNPLIYSGSGGGEVRRQNGQLWRAVCGIGKSYEVAGARLTRGLFHLLFQVRARRLGLKENSGQTQTLILKLRCGFTASPK